MQSHQNTNHQLWGYPSDLNNSNVIGSPQFRVDAIAKRSQSFIERSNVRSFSSELPSATSLAMDSSKLSGWGSPDGKLYWSICGDELNKMRKSYSLGFRNRSSTSTMAVASNVDDPDIFLSQESWVNSLVKDDAPAIEFDEYCVEDQMQFHNLDAVPSWPEQLYMKPEQMVV